MTINTEKLSEQYRGRSIDIPNRRLLMSRLTGTEQEKDFTEPANCNGYGRIRHFRRHTADGWPSNPLPIDPSLKALGLSPADTLRAQVFQNAACNWRCWYCYVPYNLLSADERFAAWLSPSDLVDLYLDQPEPPKVLDLTGGQPDLVPEWIPWMMTELRQKGLEHQVYLWSDDNLSNDYFWKYLSDEDLSLIESYPNYGRVGCFKGFNEESFRFNTGADPSLFNNQFKLMASLMELKIDIYAYATFTSPSRIGLVDDMRRFVDRLQEISEYLPLRTVPLQIRSFTPVTNRLTDLSRQSMEIQELAIEAWNLEIENRFSSDLRARAICEIPLYGS